jgi:hypothetical protein
MLEQGHRAPVINGPLLLPFRACPFRMMRPAAQGPSFILVQTASEDVAAGLECKSVWMISASGYPLEAFASGIRR